MKVEVQVLREEVVQGGLRHASGEANAVRDERNARVEKPSNDLMMNLCKVRQRGKMAQLNCRMSRPPSSRLRWTC